MTATTVTTAPVVDPTRATVSPNPTDHVLGWARDVWVLTKRNLWHVRREPAQMSDEKADGKSVWTSENVVFPGTPQSVWNSKISIRSAPPNNAPSTGRTYMLGVPGAGLGPESSLGSAMMV